MQRNWTRTEKYVALKEIKRCGNVIDALITMAHYQVTAEEVKSWERSLMARGINGLAATCRAVSA